MKLNFDEILMNLDEKTPLTIDKSKVPLTLKHVCLVALTVIEKDELVTVDSNIKYLRGSLARKIYNGGSLDINLEEAQLLKELVGKSWSPLPVMRVYDILDPPSESSTPLKKSRKPSKGK